MNTDKSFITIVSGYPRSGTSMMMQMLQAGGLPVLFEETFRPANIHNPRGFYEIKDAFQLGEPGTTTGWLANTRGMAVKVMAPALSRLPQSYTYRVIFMRRRIAEILASHIKANALRSDSPLSEEEKILAYKTEYVIYEAWLMKQHHIQTLFITYNDLLQSAAAPVAKICDFLGLPLDQAGMKAAIDPALYRNREAR